METKLDPLGFTKEDTPQILLSASFKVTLLVLRTLLARRPLLHAAS